ncbi:hypothetical protein LTR20_006729 [Exophiala xenobiotica]|nr:hypothetical protein LTS06_009220 [Exophiala xenobiotica]KAK5261396.1 hypothetical protein LTR40_002273 [Exophiala xenobiotica]KAK5371330.1 hypothetical protein LTS13_006707 [Exophiala xenobiotica]KAK5394829.1 hypothetical protein LTR79_007445 [Exophiala xenobiotica]KAK5413171.1 hypothetical protein LTR90_007293 [Exophiala xenobiotica]
MSDKQLAGKVALVTGASSGIGRACALSLAKHGASIVCCDLRAEANPQGYEEDLHITTPDVIKNLGGRAIFVQVDMSNFKQVEEAFKEVVDTFGRLDILINCAGYWASPFRDFVDETDQLWQKTFDVNTLGVAKASRAAISLFKKNDLDETWGSKGRIVNISSCAGHVAIKGEVAYSASKAALNHMTRAGAIDHAKDHINMNCVAPGITATGISRVNFEDENIIKTWKRINPWPRLGRAQDIADAVLFFCLPCSQWITGQLLPVDGGFTLGIAS